MNQNDIKMDIKENFPWFVSQCDINNTGYENRMKHCIHFIRKHKLNLLAFNSMRTHYN